MVSSGWLSQSAIGLQPLSCLPTHHAPVMTRAALVIEN